VYHAPGASYPGRSLAKGCTRQSNNQAQPTNHARRKTSPQRKENKTKSLERAASKQVQKA
jgi:hypothetical protein